MKLAINTSQIESCYTYGHVVEVGKRWNSLQIVGSEQNCRWILQRNLQKQGACLKLVRF